MTIPYQTDVDRGTFVITDAVALEKDNFVGLNPSTGKLRVGGEDGDIPVGIVIKSKNGIPSELTGNAEGSNEAVVRGGIDIEFDVTGVTGLANLSADVFATSATTLSLTNPGSALAAGYVKRHISGTKAIVHLYDLTEAKIADAAASAGAGGGGGV